MKKEKKVRTYQRRTKSGKTITVRAHTASYEAAEKSKEAAKKKGAGDELSSKVKKGEEWKLPMDEFLKKLKEERAEKKWNDEVDKSWKSEDEKPKKKSEKKTEKKTPAKKTTKKRTVGSGTNGPEPKKKATTKKTATKVDTSEPAFTRDEFKEWYRGTGSAADKKVAKVLRKQLGRSGYRKFEDEAIDNYTSRGHLSMFKRVSGGSSTKSAKESKASAKTTARAKKETSSDLRARADQMDADAKKAAIIKKLGSNRFRTIKGININVVKPNTRTAQLKGTLYVSSDKTKAYYEGSDGKLKKATKSILDRYVNKGTKTSTVKEPKQITAEQLKKEAAKGSASAKATFNIGGATYGKSEYDLYRKGGKEYAVNRKTGKLATDSMTAKIMAAHKETLKDNKNGVATKYKKRSVGTGTNGPEPKKTKSNASSSKMFRGVFSDNFGTVDKVVRNVVTSDLPKLRTLPSGIAK